MPIREPQYSKSQVRRAGKTLRKWWAGDEPYSDEVDRALTIAEDWRACHTYPLLKARSALDQRLGTVAVSGHVGQRLKRTARVIPKLVRYPAMQLDNMQDIAGCRAVVPAQVDRKILDRWRVRRREIRLDDYVIASRSSGYRAIHLVVQYDGYPIEMQLRTQLQHDWAYTVETLGGRLGYDLKSGEGPPVALDFLEVLSEGMALDEDGVALPPALWHKIQERGRRFAALLKESEA